MEELFNSLGALMIPAVGAVALFTFLAVATWSENRRKEREAFYRSETLRKAIEQGGESSKAVLDMMREEELQQMRRRMEGLRLGGLVTAAVGVGVMVMLFALVPGEPAWVVGGIPFLIGVVLAGFGFLSKVEPNEVRRNRKRT